MNLNKKNGIIKKWGQKSENASHQINTKNMCLQELDKEFKRLNKYNFEDYFIYFLLFPSPKITLFILLFT